MGAAEVGPRLLYRSLAVASEMKLGLQAMWWIEKLIPVREEEGCVSGPDFGDAEGRVSSQGEFSNGLRYYLRRI